MSGSARRPRYFQYRLRPQAFQLLLDLNPRLGRLDGSGSWVPNYEEIARQGGVLPNNVRNVANKNNFPLTELTMSALVGVAVLNGMDPGEAHSALFEHVDVRPARLRRGLRAVA